MIDWKSRALAVDVSPASWKDRALSVDSPHVTPQGSPPSELESYARGAAQGATLGFADEIAGGAEALYDKARNGSLADFMDLYRQHRDESRKNFEAAREANPKSYLAGELTGTAPVVFVPGSGIAKATALGAATGLGDSNADLTHGEVGRAAVDTAIGGSVGTGAHQLGEILAPKVSSLIDSTRNILGQGAKKVISSVLGPSEEAIDARLAGQAKDTALSYPQLVNKMKGSLEQLRDQIGEQDKIAWDKLNPISEPAFGGFDKEVLVRGIKDERKKLLVNKYLVGHADAQADQVLKRLEGDIDQFSDGVSQRDLKSIVQRLDDNINWDNSSSNATNQALSRVRSSFDFMLKDNPEYKEAMDPVAKKTALLNDIKRLFNFKNEAGNSLVPEGTTTSKINLKTKAGDSLVPTDTTASKIKTSLNENKAYTQQKLAALKEYVGDDYSALAKDYDLSREFKGGYANGSRRVNLGAVLGAPLGFVGGPAGAVVGAATGGMLGAHLDKEGGVYAGKLIDWYVKNNPESLGKFARPLQAALTRGPAALAVTHHVLQQTNQEYRDKLRTASGE